MDHGPYGPRDAPDAPPAREPEPASVENVVPFAAARKPGGSISAYDFRAPLFDLLQEWMALAEPPSLEMFAQALLDGCTYVSLMAPRSSDEPDIVKAVRLIIGRASMELESARIEFEDGPNGTHRPAA